MTGRFLPSPEGHLNAMRAAIGKTSSVVRVYASISVLVLLLVFLYRTSCMVIAAGFAAVLNRLP